ncbi:DUF86 domain-containing protein [Paenibacillus alvei]|uniref:DUF86 domain-containing protein n=1 Tax=Paenibacillus TaxID=44249 RepID=UPI000288377C|nr:MULTISPECIES: HepT-like ribonuclease domain-containing protein [Paenibacillus]EJW17618.1 hypothetical protein PAV_3c00630 [Paenibacillus alvei DSM 29]MCY7486835.1 DUF86 domain-containing protein [Paenibacillus alvei]MCY9540591.1 DUF86 domain-containing protein [Paenibacillus alvei]MCY9706992.1 DUF86 domain-containing protein [Paenibacillus alvei]MCY9736038.1 DUF86 domain-containing protein [Paenibacillus alvei]
MYYVNMEQIEQRLDFIPQLIETVEQIMVKWDGSLHYSYAQERALHIAIEIITDVGSLLIDGFLMRDASSYEDIVEIIAQEQVVSPQLHATLLQLVSLRRPLVQEYMIWERDSIHSQLAHLPKWLPEFAQSVRQFVSKELALK